jgi:predicted transglutaminase-like cysteine proteinase
MATRDLHAPTDRATIPIMGWKLGVLPAVACLAAAAHAGPYRFDKVEDYLAPAAMWDTWVATETAFRADLDTIERCGDGVADCPASFRAMHRLVVRLRNVAADDRVRAVNAWVNRRRYREDRSRRDSAGRIPNEWRSLSELVSRGGDCEDFAMAKYFLLRATGIPADRLRVVIAWDRPTRAHHALLAYDTDAGAWLVETDGTIRRTQHGQYRFLFSINEDGVWDHAPTEGALAPRHQQRGST